ncbi:hypothetical protein LJK88_19885 [Paenibacillus sp. P26]|nr:hypothetical protein LJK88_19885 [Paenibacillus sp. P26]
MISTRDLKDQIEQLTEQNQTLSDELQQIKDMLKQQAKDQSQGDQSQGNQGQSQGQNNQGQNNQSQSYQNQSDQDQNQQQNSQSGGMNSSGKVSIAQLASDFSKLKDLTSQLETKMKNLVSSNTSGKAMSEEDAVQLILYMMNGMIDWTMELVAKQSGSSGRLQ